MHLLNFVALIIERQAIVDITPGHYYLFVCVWCTRNLLRTILERFGCSLAVYVEVLSNNICIAMELIRIYKLHESVLMFVFIVYVQWNILTDYNWI